ncbi:MAG: hypothetical protein Q9222_002601 [Ikaeria aurantiellina]
MDEAFTPHNPHWEQLLPFELNTGSSSRSIDAAWNSLLSLSPPPPNPSQHHACNLCNHDPRTSRQSHRRRNLRSPLTSTSNTNAPLPSSPPVSLTSTRPDRSSHCNPLPQFHPRLPTQQRSEIPPAFNNYAYPQDNNTNNQSYQPLQLPHIDTITQNIPSPTTTAADLPPSSSQFSWDPAGGDDSFFDPDFWPNLADTHFGGSNNNNNNIDLDAQPDFVDLTSATPPVITMPPAVARKRRASSSAASRGGGTASGPSNKRRKAVDEGIKEETGEDGKVEQLDLVDLEDEGGIAKVLEQQQASAIKEQQAAAGQGDEPSKLSTVQCIICMEPMTDMTVTHCGHIFCHTCIMEALIAGENQGEPGKGTSKCPVCRKKVARPKEKSKDKREVIPLEIKVLTKSSSLANKGKEKL